MAALLFFACPLLAAFIAQRYKRRLGALWFLAVCALQVLAFLFLAPLQSGELAASPNADAVLAIATYALGGGGGLLLVLTLPRAKA